VLKLPRELRHLSRLECLCKLLDWELSFGERLNEVKPSSLMKRHEHCFERSRPIGVGGAKATVDSPET
jgi:hypothetical protein